MHTQYTVQTWRHAWHWERWEAWGKAHRGASRERRGRSLYGVVQRTCACTFVCVRDLCACICARLCMHVHVHVCTRMHMYVCVYLCVNAKGV